MDALGSSARDELLKRLIDSLSMLRNEVEDIVIEKESLGRFSKYVSLLGTLLQELHAKRVDTKPEWTAMRTTLQKLEAQVKVASFIIKNCNSKSRLHLLVNCRSMLSKLKQSSEEICRTIQYLNLGTLDSTMQLKSHADEIIRGMQSIEFKSAAATEAIVTEVEKSIAENRSRNYTVRLLQQIAEAVGAAPIDSLVKGEIAILKQEMQELESRKQHAEALQLSQLINLLYTTEMVSSPRPESPISVTTASLISSFKCEISGEIMEDPVAIVCGHSFDRKAILGYFELGQTTCPTCGEKLSSLELTRNISLQNSVREWQRRNAQQKLRRAVSSLASNQTNMLNVALEDILTVIEMPGGYVTEVSQLELVSKLAFLLKVNAANSKLALKCLYHLAQYSEQNKEYIATKGVIRSIVKQFCRGETEPEALEILLALSADEKFTDQVGNTTDCIPSLVSLRQHSDSTISQAAQKVLEKLSSKTPFVIKMAEAGHFSPFVAHFHEVTLEGRALMASALATMQLSESSSKHFENEQFINMLIKSLYSSVCKPSCLLCLKKLSVFSGIVKMMISDKDIIPALLGMMNSSLSEPQWKHEAVEILSLLVEGSEPNDNLNNPSLEELYSLHNIHFFLQMSSTSIPQTNAACLCLLNLMTHKNADARQLVQSDHAAMHELFSILVVDKHSDVRVAALRLTCSIADHSSAGIVLPPSPLKETTIATVIDIFVSSSNTQERSAAARVISHLPSNDTAIDEILLNSEVLKMIQVIVCTPCWGITPENNHQAMMAEPLTTSESNHLLENCLAALLRFTDPTKPELQKQVLKIRLYTPLIQVLSMGSCLAKEYTAIALSNLDQSRQGRFMNSTAEKKYFFPASHLGLLFQVKSLCGLTATVPQIGCTVHGSSCCPPAFCFVREGALRPLLNIVSESEPGSSEAALSALVNLLQEESTISHATTAIVENKGMTAILQLLLKNCPISAKDKALDILHKIIRHSGVPKEHSLRSRDILVSLLKVDELKRKAALLLAQMNALPQQSSYF